MKSEIKKTELYKVLLLILTFLSVVLTVKRLFIGLDVDEEYSVATIYRIVSGDVLIKELWEPHQTSSLLISLFALLFVKLSGGTECLVLFLRFIGVIIQLGVSISFYFFFKEKVGKTASLLISFLIFSILPKFIQSPEFNNMQVWFFILSCLTLLTAFDTKETKYFLLAGVFIVFEVMSYPSCTLLFVCFFGIIFAKDKKGSIPYAIPAIVSVLIAVFYLILNMKFTDVPRYLFNVLGDDSHSEGLLGKIVSYAKDIPQMIAYILIYALLALLILMIIKLSRKELKNISRIDILRFSSIWITIAFVDQIRHWLIGEAFLAYPQYCYLVLFVSGLLLFAKSDDDFKDKWKDIVTLFYIGNTAALLSILLLTNLNIKATLVHLIPCGAVALLMICSEIVKDYDKLTDTLLKIAIIIVLVVIYFGQIWFVRTSNEGRCEDLAFVRQKVLNGPAKGIYAAYQEGYELNCDYELLNSIIPQNVRVLYMGENNLVYMIGDYEVSTPSTISTPGTDSNLEEYYRINPSKYPQYLVLRKGDLIGKQETELSELDYLFETRLLGENDFVSVYEVFNE